MRGSGEMGLQQLTSFSGRKITKSGLRDLSRIAASCLDVEDEDEDDEEEDDE